MSDYGQFCPVALASEILTQKWMLLIVRELIAGASRFNEIRRGVPRISSTLLKQRLDQLSLAGIVRKKPRDKGLGEEYFLTDAGLELKPVLALIGEWGQRWARDISPADLDPGWLVWSIHRRLKSSLMPEKRTVLEFEFVDAKKSERFFWLVCDKTIDVCVKHPGLDTDLHIQTRIITLAEVWRGIKPVQQEISSGRIRLAGSSKLKQDFPKWLELSVYAHVKNQKNSYHTNQKN